MSQPSKAECRRLLDFLKDQPTDLRPAVRWLMLGRPMAETLLPEFAQEPTLQQLSTLMRWVKDQQPDLVDTAVTVAAASPYAERLAAQAQLDTLADQAPSAWKHPAQVLPRPRKPFQELLALCEWRLEGDCGIHGKRRLQSVARKLRNAIQLEDTARRRRRQMGSGHGGFEVQQGGTWRWGAQP